MNSAIAPDRHSTSERVDSSSVWVAKASWQPSFAAEVSLASPSVSPRGAYGLLVFVMRLVTSEADLTVSSLQNHTYVGAVSYLQIFIENGKIIQEFPEVPEESYNEVLCTAIKQLKLCKQSIAAAVVFESRKLSQP